MKKLYDDNEVLKDLGEVLQESGCIEDAFRVPLLADLNMLYSDTAERLGIDWEAPGHADRERLAVLKKAMVKAAEMGYRAAIADQSAE